MEAPLLFYTRLTKLDAKGAGSFWEVTVTGDGEAAVTQTRHGKTKEGSKVVVQAPKRTETGKQKRTPHQQAVFEARSTTRIKMRKGYAHADGEVVEASAGTVTGVQVRPQLVAWYKDRKRFLKPGTPADFQDKYDGMRALWNTDTGVFSTRSSKEHANQLPHIKAALATVKAAFLGTELKTCPPFLDGELFCPDRTFQETCSILKKSGRNSRNVVFMVFDFVHDTMPWDRRRVVLDVVKDILESRADPLPVIIVETRLGFAEDIDSELETAVTERSNEGVIMRLHDGVYRTNGARSNKVIKAKYFQDDEFKIVDMELEDKTTDLCGSVVFQLNDGTGRTFGARPGFKEDPDNHWGTEAGRRELWSMKPDVCYVFGDDGSVTKVGKRATVRYQELTDGGIPRFPNMVDFRDGSD